MVGLMAAQTQNARAAENQAPAVKIGLNQLNSEVNNLRESLKGTMSALEDLKTAANKNDDLNKPYSGFSTAYAELETQVTKLREHGTAVKARAKEHWDNWQKELTDMQNAKLREKAQKRYTATSGEFQKIIEKVGDAKEGFAPLAADLKDINTYLKTDLSKEAVSSLGNTIWKMGNQARSVDGKLADVNKQIERTMSKLPQT
jgi:predicted  nucleic acid-binding Zn-ribbon protein